MNVNHNKKDKKSNSFKSINIDSSSFLSPTVVDSSSVSFPYWLGNTIKRQQKISLREIGK